MSQFKQYIINFEYPFEANAINRVFIMPQCK